MKLDVRLMFPHASAKTHADLFAEVGGALTAAGLVKDTYVTALTDRESQYPTGVLTSSGGVALPHTDASHANADTVALVTLEEPIPFEPMGAPGDEPIDVKTVIFLVLTDGKAHLRALSATVKAIQDAEFIQQLHAATTPEGLMAVYGERVGL